MLENSVYLCDWPSKLHLAPVSANWPLQKRSLFARVCSLGQSSIEKLIFSKYYLLIK